MSSIRFAVPQGSANTVAWRRRRFLEDSGARVSLQLRHGGLNRVARERILCVDETKADKADAYYLTDYYRSYPVVLVRLSRIDQDALRDLLSVSWRLTLPKARKRGRT